jgi:hypothetical protein
MKHILRHVILGCSGLTVLICLLTLVFVIHFASQPTNQFYPGLVAASGVFLLPVGLAAGLRQLRLVTPDIVLLPALLFPTMSFIFTWMVGHDDNAVNWVGAVHSVIALSVLWLIQKRNSGVAEAT